MSKRQPLLVASPWLPQSELNVQPQAEQAKALGETEAITSPTNNGRRKMKGMQLL